VIAASLKLRFSPSFAADRHRADIGQKWWRRHGSAPPGAVDIRADDGSSAGTAPHFRTRWGRRTRRMIATALRTAGAKFASPTTATMSHRNGRP